MDSETECTGLGEMGYYNSVLLKSDGEPALVDLLNQIATLRKGVIVIEHSAPEESKSNGLFKRGIQMIEEMIRVYKLDLEKRIGCRLEVSSNVFAWLVEYAVDIVNKKFRGTDGWTAYERLKNGRKSHGKFVRFARKVM